MFRHAAIAVVCALLAGGALGCRQDEYDQVSRADDTAINERDRDGRTVTPLDQSESAADREVTQRLRSAIVADDSLSTNAKNVKIITDGDSVTLRGPVESEAERAKIVEKAREVAGDRQVENQLDLASNR